jgi:hypothetical protein
MGATKRPISPAELDGVVRLILNRRRGGGVVLLLAYAALVFATWALVEEPVAWMAMATFGLLPAALVQFSIYRRLAAWHLTRKLVAQGYADDVARDLTGAARVAKDNLGPALRAVFERHEIPTPEEPTAFEQTQQPTRTLDEGDGRVHIVFRSTRGARRGAILFALVALLGPSIALALDLSEAAALEGDDAIKVVATLVTCLAGVAVLFFAFHSLHLGVEDGQLFRFGRLAGREVGAKRLPVEDVVRVRLDKRRETGPQAGVRYTVNYAVVDARGGEEHDWYRSMDLSVVSQVAAALRRALPASADEQRDGAAPSR